MTRVLLVCSVVAVFLTVSSACSDEGSKDAHGGEGGELNDHTGDGQGNVDPCCWLGALCHVAGGADDPEIEACHEIGHANNRAICDDELERCKAVCKGATEHPEPHACE